jgi:hypothetical protein
MVLLLLFFTAIVCIYCCWQDVHERAISWYLFPLLFLLGFSTALFAGKKIELIILDLLTNWAIILAQLLILSAYFYLKKKGSERSLIRYLGIGDILFLVSVSTYFSPLYFLIFYILGLVFSLLTHVFFQKLKIYPNNNNTVPLAGFLAVFLSIFIGVNSLTGNIFISDEWLILRLLQL